MKIVDLHCDTLSFCLQKNWNLAQTPGHIDVQKLRAGGALCQCMAIFVPTHDAAKQVGVTQTPFAYFCAMRDAYQAQLAQNADALAAATTAADIEARAADGKIATLLTVEDAVALEGDLSRLEDFYQAGVRMVSLCWNYENELCYPNSTTPYIMGRGLKTLGIEAVQRMNARGIIVDVSHLSEGGFYDVAHHSQKPFVASHSCARALCDHPRNLSDRQLRTLGERGGVVGINFCAPFLNVGCDTTTIDDVVRHLLHMHKHAGLEALAFGSDFDGIESTLEFGDFSGYPRIIDALSRHFSDDALEKICYQNALRLFSDCL